jgi:hypothetical protein
VSKERWQAECFTEGINLDYRGSEKWMAKVEFGRHTARRRLGGNNEPAVAE